MAATKHFKIILVSNFVDLNHFKCIIILATTTAAQKKTKGLVVTSHANNNRRLLGCVTFFHLAIIFIPASLQLL
jgi:hypothetical protein